MPETRRIENYGILKLLPEERGANNLIVQSDVIQLPYSEYLNVKSNPPKSHYGYVCFMSKGYVMSILDIQFRRQIIINRERYLVQLAWQEFCNSKTILDAVANTSPDTTVDYPIWLCDELRFKLEPGVVLNVFKSHIPPTTCSGTGISEPNLGGEAPGLPASPSLPPPPNTPDEDKLVLSPPYDGDEDNGNTYVRGSEPSPPPVGTEGPGTYARYVFDRPPSFNSSSRVHIQKLTNDPTDVTRFSNGSRCGTPKAEGERKPGITRLYNGASQGCAEDSVAILEDVTYFAQTT